MSSHTKGLQQRRIISFIYQTDLSANSKKPPVTSIKSLSPEMKGAKFHSWTIASLEIIRRGKKNTPHISVRCICGKEAWQTADNLSSGKTKQCQSCAVTQRHTKARHLIISNTLTARLQKRANAMHQRCTNPNDKGYKNYGERGIRFMFSSVAECVEYMMTLPRCSTELSVDRIDNNGHYARGNLRFTSQKEQTNNRRNTLKVSWGGELILAQEWKQNPYTQMSTVCKYVHQGLTGEEIIAKAWGSVSNKCKGWRKLKERLESTTY